MLGGGERPLVDVEILGEAEGSFGADRGRSRRETIGTRLGAGLALALLGLLGWFVVTDDGSEGSDEATPDPAVATPDPNTDGPAQSDRLGAVLAAGSVPDQLLAAELFVASPSAETLRDLLGALGGIDAITVGVAEGSFDIVTFHPADPDRLLAARRSSYGLAQNQDFNEQWLVGSDRVVQALFEPELPHDFAHYNQDGSITVWANSGNTGDFASRVATTSNGAVEPGASSPVYASRSVLVDGTLFALTGSADYLSNSRSFVDLIADDGSEVTILGPGDRWAWVDEPLPGLVVAYPIDADGALGLWDSTTLEPVLDHPLSGRSYQRVASSGDGSIAVGITFDGEMEVVDLASGESRGIFGSLNPDGISTAVTLSDNGSVAITVDHAGTVTMWWVGDDRPVFTVRADAGPARVLGEHRAPRTSSVVAAGAVRIAIRTSASPQQPTTWRFLDTSVQGWVDQACGQAGRALTSDERIALGLAVDQRPGCDL